jgi:hypothetical protein
MLDDLALETRLDGREPRVVEVWAGVARPGEVWLGVERMGDPWAGEPRLGELWLPEPRLDISFAGTFCYGTEKVRETRDS